MNLIDELREVRTAAINHASIQHAQSLDLLESLRDACDEASAAIIQSAQYQAEAEFWEAKYNELVMASIRASEETSAAIVKAALSGAFTPGVTK